MLNTGDIPSTIGRSFTAIAIADPGSRNKYLYLQTILIDEVVSVEVSGCHSSYGKLCAHIFYLSRSFASKITSLVADLLRIRRNQNFVALP